MRTPPPANSPYLLKDRCPTAFQLGLAGKDSGLMNGKPPLHRILFETVSKYMKVRKDGKTASAIVGYPRLKQDTGYSRTHIADTALEMELDVKAAMAKEAATKARALQKGKTPVPLKLMKKGYAHPFLRRENRGKHAPKWIVDVAYVWETAKKRDADYCRDRAAKFAAYGSLQDEDGEDDFIDPGQDAKDRAELDAMDILAIPTGTKAQITKDPPAAKVLIDVANADFRHYAEDTLLSRRSYYLALLIYYLTGRTTVTTSALKAAAKVMMGWAVSSDKSGDPRPDEGFNKCAEGFAWVSVSPKTAEWWAKYKGCPVQYIGTKWGDGTDNKFMHQYNDAVVRATRENRPLVSGLVAQRRRCTGA